LCYTSLAYDAHADYFSIVTSMGLTVLMPVTADFSKDVSVSKDREVVSLFQEETGA